MNIKKSELPTDRKADWLGKMYIEAADYEKEHEGSAEVKEGISRTLRALEEKTGPEYQLYRVTREWSINEMHRIYEWLGVKFDRWFFESECDEPSRALVQQKLAEGVLQKSNGAVGLDLTAEGLGFVMMLKSDGNGLYLTKDLQLLVEKAADPRMTKLIVVVDDRQKLHFKQLFRSADLMGLPLAKNAQHLAYGTVTDVDGKAFSSRSMLGMNLDELRSSLEQHFNEKLTREGIIPAQTVPDTATKLAVATLKYGFLRVSPENSIKFDLKDWYSEDGNTASNALLWQSKLEKILANTQASEDVGTESAHYSEPTIGELVNHLSNYQATLAKSANKLDPSILTDYLFALTKILKKLEIEKDLEKTPKLASAAKNTIAAILETLGIKSN